QVLCGRSLAVESSDRLPDGTPQRRDWWFRSVPAGIQPGNWQLACSNISSCSVPVVANLTIVGVPSGLSPESVAQALSGQALPWIRPITYRLKIPGKEILGGRLLQLANVRRHSSGAIDAISGRTTVDRPLNGEVGPVRKLPTVDFDKPLTGP